MQSIVAFLKVAPETCATFEELFAKQAHRVHTEEPSCYLYQLAKDPKVPGSYTVIELYENLDAVTLHMDNLQKHRDPKMAALIKATPKVMIMPVIGPAGLKAGAAKIGIVAILPIKPASGSSFEDVTLQLMDQVQSKEAGNLLYCLGHDNESNSYVFSELYTDMGAIALHGKTPYFKDAGKRQGPCFAARPIIQLLQLVGDGGAKPTFQLRPRM